ncbi:MAG: hypothetical protein IKU15_01075 [Clostridia bacterium]|nr:hypothetical protein [Clostridia bacterium]
MSEIQDKYPSVKISELPSLNNKALLKNCEVAAISSSSINNGLKDNYKVKLSDHYYDKDAVDEKIKELESKLLRTIGAIEIPEEYDDTSLASAIIDYTNHIKALKNGALVNESIILTGNDILNGSKIEIEDNNKWKSLSTLENVLYKSLDTSKVIISNDKGKITSSDILVEELNALKGWNLKDENGNQISIIDKITQLETLVKNLIGHLGERQYFVPTYTTSEELVIDNIEYTAKQDGILSVIPYYSHSTGIFNIYINDTFITQIYQVYGDGHSHSGCCIPVKKNDVIKFQKVKGKQASMKAYLIY